MNNLIGKLSTTRIKPGTANQLLVTNAAGDGAEWSAVSSWLASALGGDPNADRGVFWDDSAGALTWLAPGNSVAITGTTLDTIQDIRTSASPQFTGLTLTNPLVLTSGGTNASLTASTGGIVYSGASAMAILAGTATANQLLLSGSSAAPAWSTATFPATTTINQLLYSSAANTVAGLASANSGVLVTSGTGVPSIGTDIPTAVTIGGQYVYRVGGTDVGIADGGTGVGSWTNGQLLIGNTTGNTAALATLTGTANQITVTNGASSITLATPQDLATASTPQFARLGLGVAADATVKLHIVGTESRLDGVRSAGNWFSYFQTDGSNPDTGAKVRLQEPAVTGLTSGLVFSAENLNGTPRYAIGTKNTSDLAFFVNNLEIIRFQNGGNVGIGTTTPLAKLHVSGVDELFRLDSSSASSGYTRYTNGATTLAVIGYSGTFSSSLANSFNIRAENSLHIGTGGDNIRMTILNTGNVGIGTVSPDRLLHPELADTTTAAVSYAQRLSHIVSTASTGSSDGFGVGLEFELETSTDLTNQISGTIESLWATAANATRKGRMNLYAYDTAARLGLTVEASGAAAMLGFYGVTAVVRPTALTTQLTSITHTAPGTPDYAIQALTQTTPFGFVTADEGNTVLSVILNLQTRMSEIETKLQALGLLT